MKKYISEKRVSFPVLEERWGIRKEREPLEVKAIKSQVGKKNGEGRGCKY
jgi:hypothetical protein